MKTQITLLILTLAFGVPLLAQSEFEVADVGQGAPRTTLAYMIMDPQSMLKLGGWDGERFIWQPKEEAAEEAAEEPNAEGEEKEEARKSPFTTVLDYLTPVLKSSYRVDVAITNVTISSPIPYAYIDISLRGADEINLRPDFLKREVQFLDTTFNSINVVKYASPNPDRPFGADLYAFQRMGHLYVCFRESVVTELTRGLAKGPRDDGESLCDVSRFKEWYFNRKSKTLEVWLNMPAVYDLLDQGDGATEEITSIWRNVNSSLEMSAWRQFVIGLDFDQKDQSLSFSLDVTSRRTIPLSSKVAANREHFALAPYVPKNTAAIAALHTQDLSAVWQELKPLIKNLALLGAQQRERAVESKRDAKDDEWPEDPEDVPEDGPIEEKPDRDGQPDGQDMDSKEGESHDEPLSPFEEALKAINGELSRAGLDLEGALQLFGGEHLIGMPALREGHSIPGRNLPIFVITALKDQSKLQEALSKFIASFIEEHGERAKRDFQHLQIAGESSHFILGGMVHVVPAEDAALIVVCDDRDAAAKQLEAMLAAKAAPAELTELLKPLAESGSAFFGLDLHGVLKSFEDAASSRSRKLSPYAHPVLTPPIEDLVPAGMGVQIAASAQPKSFSFVAKLTKVDPSKVIPALQAQMEHEFDGTGPELYYRMSMYQLNELWMSIKESYVDKDLPVPASFEKMIEDGTIRYALVQSFFDPRYQGEENFMWGWPGVDALQREESDGPELEIIKANEARKFISFTIVPNAKWDDEYENHIVAYQVSPDVSGGRLVLYSNGNTGWLHDSVWQQAMELTREGKAIEHNEERREKPDKSGESKSSDEEKRDSKDEGQETPAEDKDDEPKPASDDQSEGSAQEKAARNIVLLYVQGIAKADYYLPIHKDAKAGQSQTMTSTLDESEIGKVTRRVVSIDKNGNAIVEVDTHKGFVLAYLVNPKIKPKDNEAVKNVIAAWIGLDGRAPQAAPIADLPEKVEGSEAANSVEPTEQRFESLSLAGHEFSGVQKTWVYGEGESTKTYKSWYADDGWFDGVVKYKGPGYTTTLTERRSDASPVLDWDAFVQDYAKEKAAPEDSKEAKKDSSASKETETPQESPEKE